MNSASHPFRQFYRNITFDTLKERHDNFSFNKAIDTKAQIYDTIHFKGILQHPTDPVLVVFKKQQEEYGTNEGGSIPPTSQAGMRQGGGYKNDQYLNFNENSVRH